MHDESVQPARMSRKNVSQEVAAVSLADRLREARVAAGYSKMVDAVRAFGWSEQYFQHERGDRQPTKEALAQYAQGFNVSVDWLLTGRGRGRNINPRVTVMGTIGAGARVEPYPLNSRQETIERIPGDTESYLAAIVRGNDLFPNLRDGDVVYYRAPEDPASLIGKECLIKLPDGEFLIRTIEPGSAPDRYTLVSYLAGAPPIRDAHVAEASFVNAIKRAR